MATLLRNKTVGRDYTILEKYEAGVELMGPEVKSLRAKKGSLKGAHVTVRGGEAYLLNANIPPYQPANMSTEYDATRKRRLLFSKKELATLAGKESQGGLTLVPISMYTKGRNIKLEVAVVRGKKKHDKRETIKKRDAEREMRRTLKRKY